MLFRVENQNGRYVATIRVKEANQFTIHAAIADCCAWTRREAAAIHRATIRTYDNGQFSLTPKRADGSPCLHKGSLLTYWAKLETAKAEAI